MTKGMQKKSEIQIFLAHAREDQEVILKLYNRIKEAGYKPWVDKKDLKGGQEWESVIPEEIEKSQIFLACLSERSIAKRGYVQKEFRMALNQMASLPSGSIYLIPVLLDKCEIPNLRHEEYGISLRKYHGINYWESDGFAELERAIAFQYGPFIKEQESADKIAEFEYVTVDETGNEIRREKGQISYYSEDLGNGISLEMLSIPSGKFMMGLPEGEVEVEGYGHESPQHEVTVQSFFMGKFQITQAQYQKIMGNNPSNFKGDERPVEKVSWEDAVEFCQRLSNLTEKEYRLPTEAEWEYACRAGTTTAYYCGKTITLKLANYAFNVNGTTSVGKFPPNAFGLYDMHGNVWEWCQDDWHDNYEGAPKDGSAWISEITSSKVRCGGSWNDPRNRCHSASRAYDPPDIGFYDIGFRVVCRVPRS